MPAPAPKPRKIPQQLFPVMQVVEMFGFGKEKLAEIEEDGTGPKSVIIGRRKFYTRAALKDYLIKLTGQGFVDSAEIEYDPDEDPPDAA